MHCMVNYVKPKDKDTADDSKSRDGETKPY